MAAAPECLRAVGLQFLARSLRVLPALLAPAVLLGLLLGAAAAALLCRCALLRPRRRREKDDSQRLLESFNCDEKEDPLTKSEAEPYTAKEEMVLEENESPLNSNVTAFALKAKVIYPINQKFRPLADGSSNPSLHENPKQAVLPNQVTEASTSGSLESLSQGDKEDCSSSTTIHSTTSDDRFQDRAFFKVTCFPEVLTCESFDVKLCLCSLLLKELMLLDTELRKEEHVIFIQILKIYLSDSNHKKITDDLFRKTFLILKNDFEELQKQLDSRLQNTEMSGAHNSEYQTVEDLERKEREYSEHIIDNMEAFWKQIDKAQQVFWDQSKCSSAKAAKITMDLTERMIAVEGLLNESQDLQAMDIQERLFNWELMVKVVDSLKSCIPEECRCRLNVLSNILDHLTVKNKLSVRQKEELLTDLHKAFWEQLAHFTNECIQQSKDLILKRLECRAKKREDFKHRQKTEQGILLSKAFLIRDLNDFLQAYHDLLEKHWQAQWQLEEEDDCESTEAVVELYKELYSKASHALAELVNELFLQTLPVVTGLSVRECELLKEDWQENVVPQLEKWDSHCQKRWKLFKEQLLQEKKLWINEYALSSVMQKHLSEKQEKIMQSVMSRLGCLSDESVNYILQKQRLLLCSVWRRLTLRSIGMAALTRMRMSRKKSLLQELREQHMLQKSSSTCQDEDQWQLQKAVESHILEEEEKLEEETQQTHLEFHQQLVTEIQESLQFLQQHMEKVIGRTLLQHARQEAAKENSDDEQEFKEKLVEAAVESVYGTSNNINRLVENYYQQVGKITEDYEGRKLQQLRSLQAERSERYRLRKKEENEQALKEKQTKGVLNVSSTVHQRMVLQQKKVLTQFELHQQIRLEFLKQKLLGLHHLESEMENQLKEAEWNFVTELATLTRVPVTVKEQLSKRSKPAGEKTKSKRGTLKPPESEDRDDSCENIQEPLRLNSSLCRERLERPREGETEPRKNTKMLKKRGDR
ncbi:ellis-van Creveld syndrome protein [Gallus gallus]|uniref:Ellis van Creveld protein-like n=1 Tax=Gallus gallus TaxID=9031 RepID=Q670Z8_CHICK|nr:evC complex member EVC [Gallus gallus]AAT85605.1 Ellis van Creveld protein-like [Gallus gallus]|eukprot:NP_001005347.1 ellis-van Creveld syndrome protein [Gallus gallus]